jgi:hypothetical protein
MDVYASRAGVYLPLGQFARVLDLAVGVFPAQKRAEGWVLAQDRPLTVDLDAGVATLGARSIPFAPSQATILDGDIYLRADLVEALLPVRLRTDVSAQRIMVRPTEPLPFQERLAREGRRMGLSATRSPAGVSRVDTPYRRFTPPAFDVIVGGQLTRDGVDQSRRFDVRAAGDLAYAGFQAFAGSDEAGRLNDVRLSLMRKDPDGRALGPLGGVRAGLGDVFTPSAAIGIAGVGGRGVFYSSAPLETLDLSTPLALRGELALGEEVELYVNEALQASRASPVRGRYEFLNVPLTLGLNTIRLVFYGSQGQRREEVRRVNLGAGQVPAGRLIVRLGAVQQGQPVVDVGGGRQPDAGFGAPRLIGMVDYGISPRLTISGGVARFTPRDQAGRLLGFGGLRGSVGAIALQGDVAADDRRGRGATLGVAARPFGVSILAHHSEYSGGFVDETRQLGFGADLALRRASDVRADTTLSPRKGLAIPVSLDVRSLDRSDRTRLLTATFRSSLPIARYYVSTNLAYETDTTPGPNNDRLLGGLDATTLIAGRVQLRAGLSYQAEPVVQIDTAYASADFKVSPNQAVHLGVLRAAGDQGETSLQASHLYRTRWFDIASNAAYETRSEAWRVGLQLAFAFAYDSFAHGYRLARPGISTGGGVAVDAFVDGNGDRIRQPGEAPVAGLVVETASGAVTTDANGHARADGLGDGGPARLRLDTEEIDDPFLVGSAFDVEIVPRPGRMARVELPMRRSAEVELTALLQRDGAERPLAALNVELKPVGGGAAIGARSDHAGMVLFEGVAPGDYLIELQLEQAKGLGLTLAKPAKVTVPIQGGFVRAGRISVEINRERPQ